MVCLSVYLSVCLSAYLTGNKIQDLYGRRRSTLAGPKTFKEVMDLWSGDLSPVVNAQRSNILIMSDDDRWLSRFARLEANKMTFSLLSFCIQQCIHPWYYYHWIMQITTESTISIYFHHSEHVFQSHSRLPCLPELSWCWFPSCGELRSPKPKFWNGKTWYPFSQQFHRRCRWKVLRISSAWSTPPSCRKCNCAWNTRKPRTAPCGWKSGGNESGPQNTTLEKHGETKRRTNIRWKQFGPEIQHWNIDSGNYVAYECIWCLMVTDLSLKDLLVSFGGISMQSCRTDPVPQGESKQQPAILPPEAARLRWEFDGLGEALET